MKIQPFLDCLSWKTLRLGWYCLSSAHDSQLCIVFWVNILKYKWSPVFVAGGRHGGLTSRWERR